MFKKRKLIIKNEGLSNVFVVFQEALGSLEDYDKTCIESALHGVSNVVQQEWGSACPCQVTQQSSFCTLKCVNYIFVWTKQFQLSIKVKPGLLNLI